MSAIDDVKKAAADLVGHFGASRVSEYFQCFSESADFIFYTHTERLKSRKAYEDLWKSWEAEMDFKILSCTSSDQDIRMVGNNVAVYNGKLFNNVEIKFDMIGRYLGEFSLSYKPCRHGKAGVGATKGSAHSSLK